MEVSSYKPLDIHTFAWTYQMENVQRSLPNITRKQHHPVTDTSSLNLIFINPHSYDAHMTRQVMTPSNQSRFKLILGFLTSSLELGSLKTY